MKVPLGITFLFVSMPKILFLWQVYIAQNEWDQNKNPIAIKWSDVSTQNQLRGSGSHQIFSVQRLWLFTDGNETVFCYIKITFVSNGVFHQSNDWEISTVTYVAWKIDLISSSFPESVQVYLWSKDFFVHSWKCCLWSFCRTICT